LRLLEYAVARVVSREECSEIVDDAWREDALCSSDMDASQAAQRMLWTMARRRTRPERAPPAAAHHEPAMFATGVLARQREGLAHELSATARREIRRTALWLGQPVDLETTERLVRQVWGQAFKNLTYGNAAGRLEAWFASTAASLTRSYLCVFSPEIVREALEDLPELNRKILHWRYHDGLSVAEIRLKTGLSEEEVKEQLHRSRRKTYDLVKKLAAEGGG
jgi:hypothetical protein